MIYVFDLDGTLCTQPDGEYSRAEPYPERIEKVNRLYDEGHLIYIDSARGSRTGINQDQFTEDQLKRWGVKYHILRTGVKFFGHQYIDDKAILDKDFFT